MTPAIVLVEWEDAARLDQGEWVASSIEHEYAPVVMRSVGYLLFDSPAGVILTATYGDDQIAPRDQIPRGMIRRVTILKESS